MRMCVKCVRKEDNLCTMRRGRIDITKRENVGTEKRERDKEAGKAKHLGLSQLTETSDGAVKDKTGGERRARWLANTARAIWSWSEARRRGQK